MFAFPFVPSSISRLGARFVHAISLSRQEKTEFERITFEPSLEVFKTMVWLSKLEKACTPYATMSVAELAEVGKKVEATTTMTDIYGSSKYCVRDKQSHNTK
jgi:hypothetical protein